MLDEESAEVPSDTDARNPAAIGDDVAAVSDDCLILQVHEFILTATPGIVIRTLLFAI